MQSCHLQDTGRRFASDSERQRDAVASNGGEKSSVLALG